MDKAERVRYDKSNFFVRLWKPVFLAPRFFYMLFGLVVLYVLSFFSGLFAAIHLVTLACSLALLIDLVLLFNPSNNRIRLNRVLPERFSNGDQNLVRIEVYNETKIPMSGYIIDEIPERFQVQRF